jgi:microcystin-dependent protein
LAIETASYVSDLNVSNPPGSDPVGQADDHIRLLKSVLKSTFPNLTGPVTSTQVQLNLGVIPTGCILMWSGSTASVPSGYALCNGGTYAKSDGSGSVTVPDLRDRFVVGAGSTYAVAATGGAVSNTPTITVTNEAVALTSAQLPAHTHANTLSDAGHTHTATQASHTHSYNDNTAGGGGVYAGGAFNAYSTNTDTARTSGSAQPAITVNSATTGITITNASVGSGETHIHNNTAVSSSVSTLSPYYALCYIYKL